MAAELSQIFLSAPSQRKQSAYKKDSFETALNNKTSTRICYGWDNKIFSFDDQKGPYLIKFN